MTPERRLELLAVFHETIRDAGPPADWQMQNPIIKSVEIQIDKAEWRSCLAALKELEVVDENN